jgi:FKBP-type peptidyl-prolyl cis-trans isomerase SlyD
MFAIADGALVELAYVVKDDSGAVLDATEEGRPFTYVHGQHQILPGLETALAHLKVGDERDVTLAPEDAYGVFDPNAVAEVPKRAVPPEGHVAGTELTARKSTGETMVVTVKEVRDDTLVLSLNHPLAGRTLRFHVRVLQIVPAPE